MYKVILILDQLIKLIPSEKKLLLKSPALIELTAKTTTLIILFNFYMMRKNYRRQFSFILEEIFGVRLWPQLNWCSMLCHVIFNQNFQVMLIINHRYLNFVFELPSLKMSLICSYLQYLLPSSSLITLEKMFLFKKVCRN